MHCAQKLPGLYAHAELAVVRAAAAWPKPPLCGFGSRKPGPAPLRAGCAPNSSVHKSAFEAQILTRLISAVGFQMQAQDLEVRSLWMSIGDKGSGFSAPDEKTEKDNEYDPNAASTEHPA